MTSSQTGYRPRLRLTRDLNKPNPIMPPAMVRMPVGAHSPVPTPQASVAGESTPGVGPPPLVRETGPLATAVSENLAVAEHPADSLTMS